MSLATLSLIGLLGASAASHGPGPGTRASLQLPPPPAGMRLLADAERTALLYGGGLTLPEDEQPEGAAKIREASTELEEVRALEHLSVEGVGPGDAAMAARRLGVSNPLRRRLEELLDDLDPRVIAPPELAPITDLAAFEVAKVADRYDIPVEMQPLVAQYVRFFQGPGRKWFRKWVARSTRYLPVMQPILEAHGIPKDMVYLAMIESGFSPLAYSWAHASGPWQFIASTGKMYGLQQDFWVDERRDPIKSTVAAARYLKQLYRELGHWYLAWAGYNTGGGRVRRLVQRKQSTDFWVISDGRGLAKETKHYVPKLIAAALVHKHPGAFGFEEEEFEYLPPLEWDEVDVPPAIDLEVVAQAAGVALEEVVDLNPELKRWCTPPSPTGKAYRLRLPRGTAERFAQGFTEPPADERLAFKEHPIRRGDTLSSIAARYGSSAEAIMRLNGLRSVRALRMGGVLVIPIPGGGTPSARSALEQQTAKARRSGFAHRPEEELPAGTAPRRPALAQGPVKTEVIGGRTKITYGVQSGDSLWAICQKFGCAVDELRRWNNLPPRAKRLQVGTTLAIWQDGAAATAQP
jgi:membrane-bound lytic murein transglycosylase D